MAIFTEQGMPQDDSDDEFDDLRRICLFHTERQQPLHQLQLRPLPEYHTSGPVTHAHEWSPDGKQLVLHWNTYGTFNMVWLGPGAEAEREVRPMPELTQGCWPGTAPPDKLLHIKGANSEVAWTALQAVMLIIKHSAVQTIYVLQWYDGCGRTPVRFAPCSGLVSVYIDARGYTEDGQAWLLVLNSSLESVYAWPEKMLLSEGWPPDGDGVCHTWTPSGMLVAVTHACRDFAADPQPLVFQVCWHDSLPNPWGSAEASLVRALLAGLSPGDTLMELTWGPTEGLAALTGVQSGNQEYSQYKLYVMLPDGSLASTAVGSPILSIWHCRHAAVTWSPAGDRILIDMGTWKGPVGTCLSLLTSTCSWILKTDATWLSNAVFEPSGQHIAAARYSWSVGGRHRELVISIFRTCEGALLFSQIIGREQIDGQLAFSASGDQLVMAGEQGVCVVSFGQAHRLSSTGRHLCDAIAEMCSWASTAQQDYSGSNSMCSL